MENGRRSCSIEGRGRKAGESRQIRNAGQSWPRRVKGMAETSAGDRDERLLLRAADHTGDGATPAVFGLLPPVSSRQVSPRHGRLWRGRWPFPAASQTPIAIRAMQALESAAALEIGRGTPFLVVPVVL